MTHPFNNPLPTSILKKSRIIVYYLLTLSIFTACKKDEPCPTPTPPPVVTPSDSVELTFRFNSFLGTYFISAANDTIKISKLKFLFSNFKLEKTNGDIVALPDGYGFTSLTEGIDSFVIKNVPKGDYKSIRMMVGIDSVTNHANPQQWPLNHPLNPSVNDMHWGWSGGYIFNIVEGNYKNNGVDKAFTFHIALDKNARSYTYPVVYSLTKKGTFTFNVDAEKYFTNNINFSLKNDGDFSHSGDPDVVMDKFMQNVNGVILFNNFK